MVCKSCGINERIKWRTVCRPCRNEQQREWRRQNPDKVRGYNRRDLERNKDAINKHRRDRYKDEKVREKIRAQQAKYREKNREKIATQQREYYRQDRQKILDKLFIRYWTDDDFRAKHLERNRRYAILNPRERSGPVIYSLFDETTIDYYEEIQDEEEMDTGDYYDMLFDYE